MIKVYHELDLSNFSVEQLKQLFELGVLTQKDLTIELAERGLDPKDVVLTVRDICGKGE